MSPPAREHVDAWKPAIARIDVRDGKGGQAHGTGALVSDRLVLTALHVVGNRQANPPTFYDDGGEVVLRFASHETRGRVVRDSVSFSPSLDFALIECESPPPGVRPLPLRDATAVGPDARWASFGFPLAAAQTGGGIVVEGNVSDARGEYQGAEAMQLFSQQAAAGDGAPVPGLSGGPVIVNGGLVGVLRSSLMADGGRNVAGTLFACPARVIAERCAALLPPLETYPGLPGIVAGDLPDEPFRYLAWYQEKEAALFFGRNRELAEMYQQLVDPDEAPLLLLYGQSGVGKSSFLAAGLLPRMKRSHEVRYVRRDRDAGLLGSILQALGAKVGGDGAESLAQVWRRVEEQTGRPLLVIADQVEEVYSRPSNLDNELDEFLAAAAELFRDRWTRPRGRLVLSFRKEWHAEMVAHVRAAGMPQEEVFLRGMDRAGIVEVIRGLADAPRLHKRYGLSVEDGLAEDIASDLREDRGSPIAPTLQVLLTKMWKAATAANRQAPRFDRGLYDQLKRGDLLREFLREQLAVVDRAHHEQVASGLVLDLLGEHVTEADTAGQRSLAELETAYAHRGGARAMVGELKNVYLLVDSSEDRADHADATRLAHDTLALHVRRMLDESQAPGQRARRILDNRAVEWKDGASGATLDEADLKRVEQGRAGTRALTADEERLVQASTVERHGRRRRSWVVAGVAGVLGLLALGGLVATFRFWRSGQDAEKRTKEEQVNTRRAEAEARLRAMAAQAEKQILGDQVATLTAVAAVGQSKVELGRVLPAVNRALALVVDQARQVPFGRGADGLGTPHLAPEAAPAREMPAEKPSDGASATSSAVNSMPMPMPVDRVVRRGAALTFLGKKVLLIASGKEIVRWALQPGAPPKGLDALKPGMEAVSVVATSPSGGRAASGDVAGNVVLWGPDGSRSSAHQIRDPGPDGNGAIVTALAFSSEGEDLAIGNRHGNVYLLSRGREQPELVFSPDSGGNKRSGKAATKGGGGYGTPTDVVDVTDLAADRSTTVKAVAVFNDPELRLTVAAATSRTLTVWHRVGNTWRKHGEGLIGFDSGDSGLKLLAQATVGDERGLVTGEDNGTVRIWSLHLELDDRGRLDNRVFYSAGVAMGEEVIETAHVVGERVAVASNDDHLRVGHLQRFLVEDYRLQAVTDLAYSTDWTRAAYTDGIWTGLIDGAGLRIAGPFLLQFEGLPGGRNPSTNTSLAFSGTGPGGEHRLAASNGHEAWTFELDRHYPDNARLVAKQYRDHRIGAGLVKGKEVVVHAGRKQFGREATGLQATSWVGDAAAPVMPSLMNVPRPAPADGEEAIPVRSTSFDVKGAIAVRGDDAGGVEVFDLAQGRSVAHFTSASSPAPAVVLGHPREPIITVLQDGFILTRDWKGKELGIYGCPQGSGPNCDPRPPVWIYTAIAESGDGNTLAATGADAVHVWFDARGHGARPRPDLSIDQTGEGIALAVSPDGGVIATASAKGIALYDRAGQLFGELPSGVGVETLAFDPSGQILASVDKTWTLRLWRVNPDDWLKVACRRLATSFRWAEATEPAKNACASVRDKPMPSEQVGPNVAD